MAIDAGAVEELRTQGRLVTKIEGHPVLVVWDGERPYAIEDRCPHMGFPLHRGTVGSGLITCHWHHARFDLASGCTLDPFADDALAFDVRVLDGRVLVSRRPQPDPVPTLEHRLREGLEDGITLVVAKSVLGLLDAGVPAERIVRIGLEFGAANRAAGWSAGMTVLVAMANLLPKLSEQDRAMALVHGLRFVANDTMGNAPRFPLSPLATDQVEPARLAEWYRRFIDTRSPDAAERVLATALAAGRRNEAEDLMFAAVTDHVFVDEGHTLDFTNKAVEAAMLLGDDAAAWLYPTLVPQTARAERSEETSPWRHPDDLVGLVARFTDRLDDRGAGADGAGGAIDPEALAWRLLADDAETVVGALDHALDETNDGELLGRAVAYAAALRITRFHTQNDFADWNVVHHGFTTANALHQALARRTTPELLRGLAHSALRVYLDRFLNVPAARLPDASHSDLAELDGCWAVQGRVDDAGAIVAGYLRSGGAVAEVAATLGHALLHEDAGFHWYQVVEAGVRQAEAWPEGSEPPVLILAGVARFLAAHTPTRRQVPTVVGIARRLRRGEHLYEDLTDT